MNFDPSPSEELPSRLDEIPTRWSLLQLAHQGPSQLVAPARSALVLRYSQSIRGYIFAMVRHQDDAEDLAQEVLVRLMRGDFAGADPERGRFRDLLKVAVRNMVRNYWSRNQRRDAAKERLQQESQDMDSGDDQWLASWRDAVLELTWRALEAHQHQHGGSVLYTLLRLRSDQPDLDGRELAEKLGELTGQVHRHDAVRQQLRRARLRFTQLLIEEMVKGMDDVSPERVEEELTETGLIHYVKDFLPDDWRVAGELDVP